MDILGEYTVNGIPLIILVVAAIEWAKRLFLKRYVELGSIVIAWVLGAAYYIGYVAVGQLSPETLINAALFGATVAVVATGGYKAVRGMARK